MEDFWLCFVPLFVAVDAIGLLPVYLGLTEGFSAAEHRRVLWQSMLTAMIVAMAFLWVGQAVFRLLGITEPDFMIAGGVLLFGFAMSDLLSVERKLRPADPEGVGAVPIGVPLTVGPAVLTTLLLLAAEYGTGPTIAALFANLVLAWIVLWFSHGIARFLGRNGIRIVSKVVHLILAAIAVKMVRTGVEGVVERLAKGFPH